MLNILYRAFSLSLSKSSLLELIVIVWGVLFIASPVYSMIRLIQEPNSCIEKVCAPIEIYNPQSNNIVVAEIEVVIKNTRAHHLLSEYYYCCFNVNRENGSLIYDQKTKLSRRLFRVIIINNKQYLDCLTTDTKVELISWVGFTDFDMLAPSAPFSAPPAYVTVSPVDRSSVLVFASPIMLYRSEPEAQYYSDVGSSGFSSVQQNSTASISGEEPLLLGECMSNAPISVVEVAQDPTKQVSYNLGRTIKTHSPPLSITSAVGPLQASESDEILLLRTKIEELKEENRSLKISADQKADSDTKSDKQQKPAVGVVEEDVFDDEQVYLIQKNSSQGILLSERDIPVNTLTTVNTAAVSVEGMEKSAASQSDNLLQRNVTVNGLLLSARSSIEIDDTSIVVATLATPDPLLQIAEDSGTDQHQKTEVESEETVERVKMMVSQEEAFRDKIEMNEEGGKSDLSTLEAGPQINVQPLYAEEKIRGQSVITSEDKEEIVDKNNSMHRVKNVTALEKSDDIIDFYSDITEPKKEVYVASANNIDVSKAVLNIEQDVLSDGVSAIVEDALQSEEKNRFEGQETAAREPVLSERLVSQAQNKDLHVTEREERASSKKRKNSKVNRSLKSDNITKREEKASFKKRKKFNCKRRLKSDKTGHGAVNTAFEYKKFFLADKINFKVQGAGVILMIAASIAYFYPELVYDVSAFVKEYLGDFYSTVISAVFAGTGTLPLVIKSDSFATQSTNSLPSASAECAVLPWLPKNITVPIYDSPPIFFAEYIGSNDELLFQLGMDIPNKVIRSGELTCHQRNSIKKSLINPSNYEERINAIMLCGINNKKDIDCYRAVHGFSKESVIMSGGQPLPPEKTAEFTKLQALEAFSDSPIVAEAFRRLGNEKRLEQGIAIRPVVFVKDVPNGLSVYGFHLVPLCTRGGVVAEPSRIDEKQLKQELTFNIHGKLLNISKVRLELLVVTDAATTEWVPITKKTRVPKCSNSAQFTARVPKSGLFRIKVFQKGDEDGSARDYVCVDGRRMFYYPVVDE